MLTLFFDLTKQSETDRETMASFDIAFVHRPRVGATSDSRTIIHRTLNEPKITKYTPKPVRTSKAKRIGRAMLEEEKRAENAKELSEGKKRCDEFEQHTPSTISSDAQTDDIIMTDAATNFALPINDRIAETDNDLGGEAGRSKKKSWTLKSYLPKVGMMYQDFGYKGTRHLLSRHTKMIQ